MRCGRKEMQEGSERGKCSEIGLRPRKRQNTVIRDFLRKNFFKRYCQRAALQKLQKMLKAWWEKILRLEP